MRHIIRGGRYFRIGARAWQNLRDTSYAKALGGRWNVAGSFGALYLNATIEVAAANARRLHEGELYSLDDLRPEMQPDLVPFDVERRPFVDAVGRNGLRALRLPPRTPYGVPHGPCQEAAARAYAAGELGIAAHSAADANATSFVGEELAVFDRAVGAAKARRRIRFDRWYYRSPSRG
ncbi:MAG TPA: RES domain-containing protein [Candidatus Dormibacteraeota bacterium]|nr:RES domain-containing protein [Candidatus Dormibacteraeota bacterium]